MKRNTAILRGVASVMALITMLCMTATTLTFTFHNLFIFLVGTKVRNRKCNWVAKGPLTTYYKLFL